ncbi:putative tRNA 2-selenouridine synthase [Candidatus Protochlamydia naegleriophila]|uniref:Putative tRNA 2-selenouridine synthase n=1 Tax=Candidatus Protochlamydia naegleriophila TaxID=389348 RepID=A0A0U5K1I4_9BACT|nr:tRNA 2-selenouridine(34) synthase MnmH [Candidatus Protochlamydia naegleriophila]CUI15947.1 putative tRNA 2-selenouridine synthase [Candidatus Protochlamydia naegleriophila]
MTTPVQLTLKQFLLESSPILDVRSPLEYEQGHIPGSHSFPLFSDEERARVGTIYKKQSRQEAIEWGLNLAQAKIDHWMDHADQLLTERQVRVLCWRGGMRSGFLAHLLAQCRYQAATLQGGYKTFRRNILHSLNQLPAIPLIVLGGLTGSGKTAILQALRKMGEQVIDLESLANHRGSSFGGIGLSKQPSQEQFENRLAIDLECLNHARPIWIEDEGRLIGHCHIPTRLYQYMQQAPLFFLECSEEERLRQLMQLYGRATEEELKLATERITKRLGSQLTKEILAAFSAGERHYAFKKLLSYYDRAYRHQILKRPHVYSLEKSGQSAIEQAITLSAIATKKVNEWKSNQCNFFKISPHF